MKFVTTVASQAVRIQEITFSICMGFVAVLSHNNPLLEYPQVLYAFAALLTFNLVYHLLLRYYRDYWMVPLISIAVNSLLLSLILATSGGQESYFWPMYLLPIFTACLYLERRHVLLAVLVPAAFLSYFYLESLWQRDNWKGLELFIKLLVLGFSAGMTTHVSFRERQAQQALEKSTVTRTLIEQTLKITEDKLKNLIDISIDPICIIDSQGVVLQVNEAFEREYGWNLREIVGKRLPTIPERLIPVFKDLIEKVRTGTQVIGYETIWQRKDGNPIHISLSIAAIRDVSGDTIALMGVSRDIGEHKRVEETLQYALKFETLLTTISTHFINIAPDEIDHGINHSLKVLGEFAGVDRSYIFLLTDDGVKLEKTHQWCAEGIKQSIQTPKELSVNTFPWLIQEIKKLKVVHIAHIADLPPEAVAEKEIFQAQGIRSLLIVPLTYNGTALGFLGFDSVQAERVWVNEIVTPLKIVGEMFVNALERKRVGEALRKSEEQLRWSQKMEGIGRLAGGIAHDFNNLLTGIKGFSILARNALTPGDRVREDIEEVLKATNRAVNLTQQLLVFSRRQITKPSVLNLNDLVFNIDKMLRRILGEDIEMVILPASDLSPVKVDPAQFEQILINLAVNSRDAMPKGGKLTIETAKVTLDPKFTRQHPEVKPGEYVMLAFSDTGIGMNKEVKEHIFEPFYTTKEMGKGTGLGLATCYGIVKQSGGYIYVETKPHQGTTFQIYLPQVEQDIDALPVHKEAASLSQGTETILVVEDEPSVRKFALRILSQQGYHTLQAHNGSEALSIYKRHKGDIHLLLTDMVMPQMSGYELAKHLLSLRPDIKILFMSGYMNETITYHEMIEPNTAFLQKPFTLDTLILKVREVLDTPKR